MKIIFFDQNCGFCHHWIALLMRADRKNELKCASLFGKTYSEVIPTDFSYNDSLVFYNNGEISTHSNAIIDSIVSLKGFFVLIILLKIIPKFIRDYVFLVISINRKKYLINYKLQESNKFLD